MAFKPVDISGKKFNYLTAIRFVERRRTDMNGGSGVGINHFWEFKCDCGNIKIMNKNGVTRGSVKSCGCLHLKNVIRKPAGEANFVHAYHYYSSRAKRSGKVFSLSKEEFRDLTNRNCYYCNSSPSNLANDKNCNGSYKYNGIDRVDNLVGYESSNVVPCCKRCNVAKSTMSQKEFLTLIGDIYHNRVTGGT